MKALTGITLLLWMVMVPTHGRAESARSLVASGNERYAAGEYDKALESYDKALEEQPDAGEVYFNKGNVFFQKGEYDKAREAYQAAALHTKDLALEASAHYNLGNTVFVEGQKDLETDPKKTFTQWGQSIQHYQEALRLDPYFKEAAQNVEMVRLALKDLADRIKKTEEAAREQQKQRDEMKKALEELIREQEGEIQQNRALQEKAGQGSGDSLDREAQELATEQERTRQKTTDLADKVKAAGQQASPQQPDPAAAAAVERLDKAGEAQGTAVKKLNRKALEDAQKNQEEALQHLKDALNDPDAEKKDQGQCPNPQPGNDGNRKEGEDQAGEQDKPQDQNSNESGSEEKPAQQQAAAEKSTPADKEHGDKADEPKVGSAFSDSPDNILREEKENRLQLQRARQGAFKPVDKDW